MDPMDTSPPPPQQPSTSSAEPEKAPSPLPPEPPMTSAVPPSPSAVEIPPPSSSSSTLNPNPSSSQNPKPSSSQNPNGSPQTSIPTNQPISQSPFPQFSIASSFSSASTTSTSSSSSSSSSSAASQTLPSSASSSSAFSTISSSSPSLPSSSSAPPPFSAPSTTSSASSLSMAPSSSAPPPFSTSSSSASSFSVAPPPSLSSTAPPPFSAASSMARGGLAIGVPAHQPRPSLAQQQPSQPPPFPSFGPPAFSQQFGGLGRSSINVPESTASQGSAQVRPSMQSIGMMGSLGAGAQMRPSGLMHHQQRMVQPSMRSQSPASSNQSLATQKFQSHGLLRGPSASSPSSPSPSASQGLPSSSQPWMSSAPQLKQMPTPSLPSPSYRQPMRPQSLQTRPNHPQQHHHPMQLASNQQLSTTQSQQQLQAVQSQDLYGQPFSQSRMPPSMAHQQVMRAAGPGNQKLAMPASVMTQLSSVPSGAQNSVVNVDDEESGNHILTKRSIRELVNQLNWQQIGPSEKLDPEVEDFLMLVAEDFVDSITTYACSLAKHRKSTTLEPKDILLHLERNWNMSVPGFGGEEIKSYKKPFTSDIHKERLVAIKKSMQGSDTVSAKSTGGQATGNVKGHSTKAPLLGSP